MEDELGGRIKEEFSSLRYQMYNYLTDNACVNIQAKGTGSASSNEKLNLRTTKSVWKILRH